MMVVQAWQQHSPFARNFVCTPRKVLANGYDTTTSAHNIDLRAAPWANISQGQHSKYASAA
jgi:hypothetical protein